MSFSNRPRTWAALGLCLLAAACQRNDAAQQAEPDDQPQKKQEAKAAQRKADDKVVTTDWPRFNGPDGSGISKEKGLLKEWPKAGPKLLWQSSEAGKGFAGMAVVKGVVYTMGARDGDEYAIAIDDKGKEKWATKLGPVHDWKTNSWSHGPNCTPAVDGDLIFCLTSKGVVACVDKDGKEKWSKDLPKVMAGEVDARFGGFEKLGWGYSWSPIVDGDQLLVAPGGKNGTLAGLDKKTGKLLWSSKDFTEPATYATPTLATIHGVKQLVYVYKKGVVGVSAKDGSLLWNHKWEEESPDIITAVPIVVGDLVYYSVGYGQGQEGLKVSKTGEKFAVKSVFADKDFASRQSNVILLDKHVFGFHEDRQWMCVEFATGMEVWKRLSPKLKPAGMVYADGRFYVLNDPGPKGAATVTMLDASPKAYKLISSFPLPAASKNRKIRGGVWTYPALSDGKLYLRDQELIFCYEVK
jgi:outer membrane protein assembly factor BamB